MLPSLLHRQINHQFLFFTSNYCNRDYDEDEDDDDEDDDDDYNDDDTRGVR